ncbi:LysR family transcriptional regulator [Phaeobacter sp. C3_T13_0]|uniref:LysR family transcriptional regulator n=1 Tax=Phaeobacter cretensis TaxID=3342641 RepID=UPI0039BD3DCF
MKRADLLGLRLFHAIVAQGTLRAASEHLGVNASAVSQQLKAFEDSLGTALFVRNTRSVVLTDAGHQLLERTRHLMGEADAAIAAIKSEAGTLSGPLRITLPFRAWQICIAPRVAAFQRAYPDITLNLSIDEDFADITDASFHAGIRLGDVLSGDVIAKSLSGPMPGAYIATPTYLDQFGHPETPSDLLAHRCIRHRQISADEIAPWIFDIDGERQTLAVTGSLVFNDLRSVVDAALHGLGICWSLRAGVAHELDRGQLVQILTEFTPKRSGFYIYFPRQLQGLPRLRAFIEHFS